MTVLGWVTSEELLVLLACIRIFMRQVNSIKVRLLVLCGQCQSQVKQCSQSHAVSDGLK